MSLWLLLLLHFAVLAYAVVAGVFLAFSDFIMRSLAHTGGSGGVEAMQHINREVFRWVFMALFLGLAPLSVAIAAYGALSVGGLPGALIVLAGLTYLFGCFIVTVVFNVPMNESLAQMESTDASAQDYWTGIYLPRWTFWNSVRTAACSGASVLLLISISLSAAAH